MSRAPYSELLVLTQDTSSPEDLLRLVDNVAFRITRLRLNLQSGTDEWDAYLAFQHGYAEQMSFLRTSDVNRRDAAVIHYTQALQVDTDYHLAHYNLANVLYNRYTQEDNARAGAHFMAASDSADGTLRALALAGLTVTYAQNTHRFGLGDEPWTTLADATSEEALALAPKLEESVFARAWAHQISGRTDAAIEYYTKVMELDGSSLMERQIKSYALNNRAYLLMYDKKDIDQAEQLLLAAPDKNKMTYANLAEVCKRRRMYSRALDYFEKARILDPRYVNAINETAIVYVAMAAEVELDKRDELLAQAARWHKRALYTVPAKALDQRRTVRKAYDAAIQAYSVVAPLSADILADPPVITQDGSASAELLLRSTRVERT